MHQTKPYQPTVCDVWCGKGQDSAYKTLCSIAAVRSTLSMANGAAYYIPLPRLHQTSKFMNELNLYTLGNVRFWYAALRSTICDVLVTRAKRFVFVFLFISFLSAGRALQRSAKISHVHTFTVLIQWRAMRENTWKYKILQEKRGEKNNQQQHLDNMHDLCRR